MNGFFSPSEAKHLTPDEFIHYWLNSCILEVPASMLEEFFSRKLEVIGELETQLGFRQEEVLESEALIVELKSDIDKLEKEIEQLKKRDMDKRIERFELEKS